MIEIKVQTKYLRIAPRKVRLVAHLIKGLSVLKAEEQLRFLNKKSARPVLKLLRSGIAAATNNYQLNKDKLMVQGITVDKASTLKRWLPRAFGRATVLRKFSSHIKLVLQEQSDDQSGVIAKKSEKNN